MRNLVRLAGVVLTLAIASAAALALAKTTTVKDKTGDVTKAPVRPATKKDVDITAATAGTDGGKVKLSVSVKGEVKDALAAPAKGKTAPAFFLAERGASSAGFEVAGSTKSNYIAVKFGGQSTPVKVGTPSVHKATFTFDPKAIGLPGKYEWSVAMNGCQPLDQAPNKGFANGQAKRC